MPQTWAVPLKEKHLILLWGGADGADKNGKVQLIEEVSQEIIIIGNSIPLIWVDVDIIKCLFICFSEVQFSITTSTFKCTSLLIQFTLT